MNITDLSLASFVIKKKFIIIDYGVPTGLITLWLMIMEIVNV